MNELEQVLRALAEMPSYEWGPGASTVARKALADRSLPDEARAIAASCVGDLVIADDDAVRKLLSIAQDRDEPLRVRCAAAIALGPALEDAATMEDDSAISEDTFDELTDALRDLYEDAATPDALRQSALEASVRAPAEWHAGAVRNALSKPETEWRRTAVFCMHYVGGFDDEIVRALDDREEDIRYWAVVGAGSHEIDAAWNKVLAILQAKNTDKDTRIAAIEALAQIRPKEAGPILVEHTGSDDPDIAGAADEALMMAQGLASLGDDEGEEA